VGLPSEDAGEDAARGDEGGAGAGRPQRRGEEYLEAKALGGGNGMMIYEEKMGMQLGIVNRVALAKEFIGTQNVSKKNVILRMVF